MKSTDPPTPESLARLEQRPKGPATPPIPLDKDNKPLAWQTPDGTWADAWNGLYWNLAELQEELPNWNADESRRVLAHGEDVITQDEAEARVESR